MFLDDVIEMGKKIKIITPSIGEVLAEIDETRNPKTAKAILEALPIKSKVQTWGDEIYFSIPVYLKEENSQQDVEIGDLGYWPEGNSFCIFFGRTPISKDDKPRAYSPVNVFGRVLDDPSVFKKAKNGEEISVKLVS